MSNPQLEDGYLKLANEIVKKFANYRIPGEEWQILWTIFNKTYGWNKKTDRISLSQFQEYTGLKKPNIIRAIKNLLSKKIIIIKNDNEIIKEYGFNKDFSQWKLLSKKIIVIKNDNSIIKNDNKSLSKMIPTKDNIKDTITKDNIKPTKKEIADRILFQINSIGREKGIIKRPLKQNCHILARLREGYSESDLLCAINNVMNNEWHLETRKAIDLEYVFRRNKIESHINMKPRDNKRFKQQEDYRPKRKIMTANDPELTEMPKEITDRIGDITNKLKGGNDEKGQKRENFG